MQVLRNHGQRIVCCEWQAPGNQFVQHHPQRVQISPSIDDLTQSLLGRQVEDGPCEGTLAGDAAGNWTSQSEVSQLGGSIRVPKDVLRLQVPVHQSVSMGVLKRSADLLRHPHDLRDGAWAARMQRGALDELHDNEGGAIGITDIVDRHDIGVVQPGCRPGFVQQPGPACLPERLRVQHLDRHLALQQRVAGAEKPAHPPTPELGHQMVSIVKRASRAQAHGCVPEQFSSP